MYARLKPEGAGERFEIEDERFLTFSHLQDRPSVENPTSVWEYVFHPDDEDEEVSKVHPVLSASVCPCSHSCRCTCCSFHSCPCPWPCSCLHGLGQGGGVEKICANFFVPPLPLLRGYPPKKELAPPVGIFFCKEDLRVTFTLLHCAP